MNDESQRGPCIENRTSGRHVVMLFLIGAVLAALALGVRSITQIRGQTAKGAYLENLRLIDAATRKQESQSGLKCESK